MSVARAWELQTAVYAALSAALATAGEGGAAVPVFDHVATDAELGGARLHVRLDAFAITPIAGKTAGRSAGDFAEHSFMAHVFDRATGDEGGRGQREVKRVSALVAGALAGLRPAADDPAILLRSSSFTTEDDGATEHAVSRFSILLGG